jgi:hypothetical protein
MTPINHSLLFSHILRAVSQWRGFEQYAGELKQEFEEWLGVGIGGLNGDDGIRFE